MDLAADNRAQPAQPGHDVAVEPTASDHDAEALAHHLDHAVTHDILGSDDQHRSAPSQKMRRIM